MPSRVPSNKNFTFDDMSEGITSGPFRTAALTLSEARDEAARWSKDDRNGSASVISSRDECDRQCCRPGVWATTQ